MCNKLPNWDCNVFHHGWQHCGWVKIVKHYWLLFIFARQLKALKQGTMRRGSREQLLLLQSCHVLWGVYGVALLLLIRWPRQREQRSVRALLSSQLLHEALPACCSLIAQLGP